MATPSRGSPEIDTLRLTNSASARCSPSRQSSGAASTEYGSIDGKRTAGELAKAFAHTHSSRSARSHHPLLRPPRLPEERPVHLLLSDPFGDGSDLLRDRELGIDYSLRRSDGHLRTCSSVRSSWPQVDRPAGRSATCRGPGRLEGPRATPHCRVWCWSRWCSSASSASTCSRRRSADVEDRAVGHLRPLAALRGPRRCRAHRGRGQHRQGAPPARRGRSSNRSGRPCSGPGVTRFPLRLSPSRSMLDEVADVLPVAGAGGDVPAKELRVLAGALAIELVPAVGSQRLRALHLTVEGRHARREICDRRRSAYRFLLVPTPKAGSGRDESQARDHPPGRERECPAAVSGPFPSESRSAIRLGPAALRLECSRRAARGRAESSSAAASASATVPLESV